MLRSSSLSSMATKRVCWHDWHNTTEPTVVSVVATVSAFSSVQLNPSPSLPLCVCGLGTQTLGVCVVSVRV